MTIDLKPEFLAPPAPPAAPAPQPPGLAAPPTAPATATTTEAPAGVEENTDDDVPLEGDILEPGTHLIEVATIMPCRRDVLLEGMKRIGFSAIRPDESRTATDATFAVREHRFIADLARPIGLHQPAEGDPAALANGDRLVRWTYTHRIETDLAKNTEEYRLSLQPFELEQGVLYEALFMSRLRTQPNRAAVEEHLKEMGFLPVKLTALRRDARIKGRDSTSVTIWFGLLEWDTVPSVVTEEDPFYFEELKAI